MKIADLIKYTRGRKWGSFWSQIFIVFIGIFFGLQADAFYERTKENRQQKQLVDRIEKDFVNLRCEVAGTLEFAIKLRDSTGLLKDLTRHDESPGDAVLRPLIYDANSLSYQVTAPASFVSMVASGKLSVLSDDVLRELLTKYGQATERSGSANYSVWAMDDARSYLQKSVSWSGDAKRWQNTKEPATDFGINKIDWQLLKQSETELDTIQVMQADTVDIFSEELEAIDDILRYFEYSDELDKLVTSGKNCLE